ncbi:hypothetical protein F5I97DRAFT_66299 [Phlebopus sp. FC_14]|nr:hypothetical protein F5I97DRAFT_66299 [Phlebopus sp. FC_14]
MGASGLMLTANRTLTYHHSRSPQQDRMAFPWFSRFKREGPTSLENRGHHLRQPITQFPRNGAGPVPQVHQRGHQRHQPSHVSRLPTPWRRDVPRPAEGRQAGPQCLHIHIHPSPRPQRDLPLPHSLIPSRRPKPKMPPPVPPRGIRRAPSRHVHWAPSQSGQRASNHSQSTRATSRESQNSRRPSRSSSSSHSLLNMPSSRR